MLVQGSSWDECLAIITTNSFDQKRKQEGEREACLYVPGASETLRGYYNLLFYYGTYVYFTQTDILSATHAE